LPVDLARELFRVKLRGRARLGAGAALGVKLAEPDRQVIAVLGDGSYLFANPVAVHHAATLHRLSVLLIVVNTAMWGAVRRATLGIYPQGEAARSNRPPFIELDELPIAGLRAGLRRRRGLRRTGRGSGRIAAGPGARLARRHREKHQALLNVICQGGGGG
jgi:acetolactate synthase I/II/III large subunit